MVQKTDRKSLGNEHNCCVPDIPLEETRSLIVGNQTSRRVCLRWLNLSEKPLFLCQTAIINAVAKLAIDNNTTKLPMLFILLLLSPLLYLHSAENHCLTNFLLEHRTERILALLCHTTFYTSNLLLSTVQTPH